jgi:LPXTG-motif cell wall-anchored protein
MNKRILKFLFLLNLMIVILSPFKTYAIANPALKSLSVDGVGNLNVNKSSITINFKSSLGYVNVTAVPADSSYQVTGDGKLTCKDGKNTFQITVTDPSDKSSKIYTLNVNYTTTSGNKSANPDTGAFINISFIIAGIVLLALIIYIIKKNNKFYHI